MRDIIDVIIFLFVALIISHTCLKFIPALKNKKLWTILDYVWISIAALGLITATANVRKLYADNELDKSKNVRSNTFELFKDLLRMDIYTIERNTSLWQANGVFKDSSELNIWMSAITNLKRIDSLITSDSIHFSIEETKNSLNLLIKSTDSYLANVAESKLRSLKTFETSVLEYDLKVQETKNSLFENIIVWATPFLLIVAFTIRFTKVTAQLKYFN